jgi:hypothetical protein
MTDKEQVLNVYPEAKLFEDWWAKTNFYRYRNAGIKIKGGWLVIGHPSNTKKSVDEIWTEGWKIIQCDMLRKLES